MSNIDTHRPSGSLKISKDVIATIAKTAAMEVDGVASMSARDSSGAGLGRRAIKIALADDFAEIDVGLKLKFGASIPGVCSEVQAAIKDNVQTMTGIAVSKVNVTVSGISFPENGAGTRL